MMLKVDDLTFSYGDLPVLRRISFNVKQHSITAVLGPNGSGKTTLLRCMNRILEPGSGSVSIDGDDIEELGSGEIARKVAYVAQRSEPGRITAFDAVLLGRKPHMGFRVSDRDLSLTHAALHRLGLTELALRYTHRMSGGEYQKVCLARALVQEPSVMLLDEPTASLDLKNQLGILRLLRTIIRGHSMCAVVTMHDLNTAFRYADRFLFLKNGRIISDVDHCGITPEIIQEAYGVPVQLHMHQGHPVILPLDDRGESGSERSSV